MKALTRILAVVVGAVLTSPGLAAAGTVRIEQDWEITIGSPDPDTDTPQISLWLKPDPKLDFGGLVLINHRDYPAFGAGGIQVQVWEADQARGYKDLVKPMLTTKGEKITLTVYLETKDGKFHFGVLKGSSDTYGDLAEAGLGTSLPTVLTSFPNYSTKDTVDNSKIIAGANRVQSMKILQVRTFDDKGVKKELGGTTVYSHLP